MTHYVSQTAHLNHPPAEERPPDSGKRSVPVSLKILDIPNFFEKWLEIPEFRANLYADISIYGNKYFW
jgi:hypothetical protein